MGTCTAHRRRSKDDTSAALSRNRRDRARAGRPVHEERRDAGFSLVELMVATAVMAIVMAATVTGLMEGQRGIATVVARETDVNQAEVYLAQLTSVVRQADSVAVYGPTGPGSTSPYTQLWVYNASPPVSWPYNCSVWVYDTSTSPSSLEVFTVANSSADPVELSAPTLGQISATMSARGQLPGVRPSSYSGVFSVFSGYPGLVDVSADVQYSTSSQLSSRQDATSPVALELETDNANVSSGSGVPVVSAGVPGTNCY